MNTLYNFNVKTLNGQTITLEEYRNKVLLIVNTASRCGFTPQYQSLEQLYQQYKDQGLVVLGFPCNQFGKQEPGSHQEIARFCQINYSVSFPMFEKIEVNGANTHPLYQHLKASAPGILGSEAIKWNFTKFLVNKNGEVYKRYGSMDTPAAIEKDIKELL